ncbi:hypothetical protein BH10BAC5_BH10BAC5_17090 [soil metagenome]
MAEDKKFTTINHNARDIFGLNVNEYCIADSIYHLSSKARTKFWCVADKVYMGKFIGISEKQVHRIIKKLMDMKLVIKCPQNAKLLRTTDLWADTVHITEEEANKRKGVRKIIDESLGFE